MRFVDELLRRLGPKHINVDTPSVYLLTGEVIDDSVVPPLIQVGASTTATPCPCVVGYYPVTGDFVMILVAGATRLALGTVIMDRWTSVTFQNSWQDESTGGFQGAEYRRVGDEVQVRGAIEAGTLNTAAFTLPVGFRPPARLIFGQLAGGNAIARVDVTSAGEVIPVALGTGGTTSTVSVNLSFSTSVD